MPEAHFPECKLIDECGYMEFAWQMYFRGEQTELVAAGDVTGPASATPGHVVLFANASGTALADGGSLGTAAFQATGTFDLAGAAAAAIAASQPRNAKLTTIAAAAPVASGGVAPPGGIGTADGGWDTAANRDAAIALLNTIRTALIANGILS